MRLSKQPIAVAAVLLLGGCGQLPGAIEGPTSGPGLDVQSRSYDSKKKDNQKTVDKTVVAVTVQTGDYNDAITQAGKNNTGIIQGKSIGTIAQVGQVNGANSANGLLLVGVLQSNTQALVGGGGKGGGEFGQISQPIQQLGEGPQLAAPQAGIQQVDSRRARFSQESRTEQD